MGDRWAEGYFLSQLGLLQVQQGNPEAALTQGTAVLNLGGDNNPLGEGVALRTIASAYAVLDQPTEADINFSASLAVLETTGHQVELARTRWAYGQFLVQQGDRERGIDLMAQCVAYEQRIGHAKAEEHAALVERLRAGGELPG